MELEQKRQEEEPKEKNGRTRGRNLTLSYSIWAMAGLYLLYLAYSIVTNSGEEASGMLPLVFAGLFVLTGLYFLISGVRGLFRLDKEKREQQKKENEALYGKQENGEQ